MSNRLTIAVDLDDVCYSFVERILTRYNDIFNDNVQQHQITEWNIHNFLKPECANVFSVVDKTLFDKIRFTDGTIEALTRLNEDNDLFFVTSGSPHTMDWRDEMLKRNLIWYRTDQLVMMKNKSKFNSAYLIDDCAENIQNCGKNQTGILFDKPWNKTVQIPSEMRVKTLLEAVDLIDKRKGK